MENVEIMNNSVMKEKHMYMRTDIVIAILRKKKLKTDCGSSLNFYDYENIF